MNSKSSNGNDCDTTVTTTRQQLNNSIYTDNYTVTQFVGRDVINKNGKGLAVWLSGNALASINVVALRQTRLVLGWVTVCGRVNHFGM